MRPFATRPGAAPALVVALAALQLLAMPQEGVAQSDRALRFGFSVGGVSTLGIVLETQYAWGSMELMLGTWSFRDVSISLVHKQYPGGGAVKGVVGMGLWWVLAFPPDERTGMALMARAPLGVQWGLTADQFVSLDLGLNRALFIRRTDPEDDTPPSRRLVPLPGMSYRWLAR